ncbi:dihydrofolate reductase family protein [Mesorhizobium sp. M0207]|uniref:dihydrofolate reductase family protein n=1 Tax=Mesorhizobium sp. M0207 TaxID=2956915 RepID=UPI003339293F
MRKLIVTEFISVDGIGETAKRYLERWDAKFNEDELADSGAMLLGRATHEIFAGSWPKEIGDFADRFNALPKYVASTSLTPRGSLPRLMRVRSHLAEGGRF